MHKHFFFPLACLSFNLSMQRPVWDHPRSNLHYQHQRAASYFNTWLGARVDLKVLCHLPFNPVHVEMVQNCLKISQGQRKMREIPLIPPPHERLLTPDNKPWPTLFAGRRLGAPHWSAGVQVHEQTCRHSQWLSTTTCKALWCGSADWELMVLGEENQWMTKAGLHCEGQIIHELQVRFAKLKEGGYKLKGG